MRHTTGRVGRVVAAIVKAGKARVYVPANHAMNDDQVRAALEELIRKDHIALVYNEFEKKYLDYLGD